MSGLTAHEVRYRLPASIGILFGVLAVLGGVALAVGLTQTPQRIWPNILLVSYYLAGLGLGALLFVALLYLTGARWSLPLRRIPEAMTAILPWAALGLLAVFLCRPSLYSWTQGESHGAYESPLHQLWLKRPFFLVRALIYLLLWVLFAMAIVRNSRQQDRDGDPARTWRNIRLSAAFVVVFGITCWLASYDWIMSLEPQWASTIFAVYNFAGLFLSALAAVALLALWLRLRSPLRSFVTEDHLHDLGTLLFSFSSFWMYTWFCQYLLIWYVNDTEETAYYRQRWHGIWPAFLILVSDGDRSHYDVPPKSELQGNDGPALGRNRGAFPDQRGASFPLGKSCLAHARTPQRRMLRALSAGEEALRCTVKGCAWQRHRRRRSSFPHRRGEGLALQIVMQIHRDEESANRRRP
jgi:hypothetical protein